jgi:hypothetical protein
MAAADWVGPGYSATPRVNRLTRFNAFRAWLGYFVVLSVYGVVFSSWQAEPVPHEAYLTALALAALCLLPLTLWYGLGTPGVPTFELICIAYLFSYSAPVFLQINELVIRSSPFNLGWDETTRAARYATFGVAAMMATYYFCRRGPVLRRLPTIDLPLGRERTQRYIRFGFLVGVVTLTVLTVYKSLNAGGLGALLRPLANQLYIALILEGHRVREESGGRTLLSLRLLMMLTVAVLLGLSSGMLENALVPLVLVFLMLWEMRRRLPLAIVVLSAAMFLPLNAVKTDYRAQAWYGDRQVSMLESVTLWYDNVMPLITSRSGDDAGKNANELIQSTTSRFDLIHTFSLVMGQTPAVIGHSNGETYGYLIYGWIPRALWPEKPIAQQANVRFAVDYGLLIDDQTGGTMIGIGHIAEAYANFGTVGIIVVMALMGVFFAVVDRVFNSENSEGGKAVHLTAMVYCLNGIGTATTGFVFGVFQGVVANSVLIRAFIPRDRQR